jgi:RecB family endonuclease NucS
MPGYSTPPIEMARKREKDRKERDFCKDLLTRKDEIIKLLGLSKNTNMLPEAEMYPYGRCDFTMLDRDNRVAVALEIKVGEAPSSTVSQIDKYMLCLELDMIRGSHDEVRGVVIADSFPYLVSSEFSRMGVDMVLGSASKLGFFAQSSL